jgi:hypothetical protein
VLIAPRVVVMAVGAVLYSALLFGMRLKVLSQRLVSWLLLCTLMCPTFIAWVLLS